MKPLLTSNFTLLLLCFLARPVAAATTPTPGCLGFEDLPLGATYANGDNFTNNGRSLAVGPFSASTGPVITGTVSVIDAVAADEAWAGAWGLELLLTSANIGFNVPGPGLNGLTLRFGDYSGDLNLRINGDARRFANVTDIDGQVIGGVNVAVINGQGNDAGNLTLDGAITEFIIGGEALYLDDLCPNSNVPLPAAVLHRYAIDQAAHPNAVYNDGTTPLFYFRRGVGSGADKWLFWFKGGGSCYDAVTCADRGADKTSNMPWLRPGNRVLQVDNRADGIFNPNQAVNPDFYNWNHVFLVYGSSDQWAGTADAMIDGVRWRFRGHEIVNAFFDAAQDVAIVGAPTLLDASEVLLTGSSGGGHGLLNNVDRLAQRLANAIPNVRVSAIADAPVSPAPDPTRQAQMDAEHEASATVWHPVVDASCAATIIGNRSQCLDGARLVDDDHIATPLFVHKDQLDPLVLAAGALSPCNPAHQPLIDAFGAEVRRILGEETGAFSPRWGRHVILTSSRFYNRPIDGNSMAEIVGNWYTGNQPTQAIQQPDPSEANQPKRCPDLGDAPDSTNHYTLTNTAYVSPTVSGHFPTVHFVAAGDAPGPYHVDTTRVWLGDNSTVEDEADAGEDVDEENNLLDGGLADTADNDAGDDGWLNPTAPITHCQSTTLQVRVARAVSLTVPSQLFLNVWFDGNRDGDWADVDACPDAESNRPAETQAAEWLVRNFVVDTALLPIGSHLDLSVTTALALNTAPALDHWVRFTLSEQRVQPLAANTPADGRGPDNGYQVGETEDYLTAVSITVNPDGTFTPTTVTVGAGQTVRWTTLSTTDSIARIGRPGTGETQEQICGAVAGGSSEAVTAISAVNFSGPKRKGIAGIHVLAPQGYGYIETSTTNLSATCNDVLNPGSASDVYYHTARTVTDTVTSTLHLLCSKRVRTSDGWEPAADDAQGAISQVVPSVWDNPDIDGVVLRVRWQDFQYYDGTSVVTVWDDIDRAFREAIKRGKLVSINFHAGEDTPLFIFTNYVHANGSRPPESNVEPVFLRDYASDSDTPATCGQDFWLGSPTDPNYVAKIKGLYDALAEHVKADARFFQALGYVKVSGLNLFTGEARLPKRCLDPTSGACLCNTEIWANAVYSYTPTGLYTYYNEIENHIFSAFMGEKSLHYMLIQDGFPRVLDANNYFRDYGPVGSGFPGPFEQTRNILKDGRLGRFAQPGAPLSDDPAIGKLFVAQHSGLSLHPGDKGKPVCPQTETPAGVPLHIELTDANGKIYHDVYTDSVPPLGEVGSGCPNQWAVEEGYRGQIIGFQTMNDVDDPNEVDSSLWNMMSASNAVYYEIYEGAAWVIARQKGSGPNAAVLDELGYFPVQGAAYQKNLHQWGQQLHQRRARLASLNSTYIHLADPFPAFHTHQFAEPLNPDEVRDFWYINPGRCMASPNAQPYGHIRVVGQ